MKKTLFLSGLTLFAALIYGTAALGEVGGTADLSQPALSKTLRHISFVGGDGSSCQKAVVIRKAANQAEGVAAEKAWIAWKYPNAKIKGQAVNGAKNKTFDVLDIETATGNSITVCFDITDFFGQW